MLLSFIVGSRAKEREPIHIHATQSTVVCCAHNFPLICISASVLSAILTLFAFSGFSLGERFGNSLFTLVQTPKKRTNQEHERCDFSLSAPCTVAAPRDKREMHGNACSRYWLYSPACVSVRLRRIVAASQLLCVTRRFWRVAALCFRTLLGARLHVNMYSAWPKVCAKRFAPIRLCGSQSTSQPEPVSQWTLATLASQNSIHIQFEFDYTILCTTAAAASFRLPNFYVYRAPLLGTDTECMWDELVLDTSSLVFPVLDGIQVSSVGVCSSTDFQFQRI